MKPHSIFILTGAGISKESGLDTFRDKDGIWAKYKVENVATPEGYARNPTLVHEFYNNRRAQLFDPSVKPNAAHLAIARLQKEFTGTVHLVTQNIDDLHERALAEIGSNADIVHMHGELRQSLCAKCAYVDSVTGDLSPESSCKKCGAKQVRPNIVWFGEMPYYMDKIMAALADCDLFISIGTSGNVYPAAGFVREAKYNGCARAVELNLERSEIAHDFDEHFFGLATEIVPKFIDGILKDF